MIQLWAKPFVCDGISCNNVFFYLLLFVSLCAFVILSFRGHPHGGPSPTGTPSSGRRGRQLPQLPAKSSSIEQGKRKSRVTLISCEATELKYKYVSQHLQLLEFLIIYLLFFGLKRNTFSQGCHTPSHITLYHPLSCKRTLNSHSKDQVCTEFSPLSEP